jgi:hypothetical protein
MRRWGRELAEVSEPGLGDGDGGPALLLPERAVVGFTGRDRELGLLRAWCGAGGTRAVQVMAGAGGVGKTRLALEVAAGRAAQGGLVVQVAADSEAGVLEQARAVSKGPVLLTVDDAETRGGLSALLEAVLADPGPVRVLLVARSQGEWRDRLAEEAAPAVAALLATHDPVLLDAPVADATVRTRLPRHERRHIRRPELTAQASAANGSSPACPRSAPKGIARQASGMSARAATG